MMQARTEAVTPKIHIPDRLFFKIGDVAELLGVKPYVLRYWETEFTLVSPQKSQTGQRVYRRSEVESLLLIKKLLYEERYSIEGARKRIKEFKRDGTLKAAREALVMKPDAPLEIEIPAAVQKEFEEAAEKLIKTVETEIPSTVTVGASARVREIAREIHLLASVPVSEFF